MEGVTGDIHPGNTQFGVSPRGRQTALGYDLAEVMRRTGAAALACCCRLGARNLDRCLPMFSLEDEVCRDAQGKGFG